MARKPAYDGSTPLPNARHERFAHELLIDRKAGRAYERAGYVARGASADQAGSRLLRNVKVSTRAAFLEAQHCAEVGMSADEVLDELRILGTSNVEHYEADPMTGRIELAEGAPADAMRAVASVKRKARVFKDGSVEYSIEYRLWSKTDALRMKGTHHGLFVERKAHEVSGPGGGPIPVTGKVTVEVVPARDEGPHVGET